MKIESKTYLPELIWESFKPISILIPLRFIDITNTDSINKIRELTINVGKILNQFFPKAIIHKNKENFLNYIKVLDSNELKELYNRIQQLKVTYNIF